MIVLSMDKIHFDNIQQNIKLYYVDRGNTTIVVYPPI